MQYSSFFFLFRSADSSKNYYVNVLSYVNKSKFDISSTRGSLVLVQKLVVTPELRPVLTTKLKR